MSILNRWFEEVWNQGRESAIDELTEPDAGTHGLVDAEGKAIAGREAFKALFRSFHAAFSEIHVKVEEVVEQGDLSVARCVVTGKHTGGALGMTPKGNRVEFTGMCMIRERDGRIAEAWNNFDFATMYRQME
jgi:predicted ester cyclase